MATTYVVTSEVARLLREARIKQKKSQSQVARALNASQTTIQKIEIGQAKESSFLKQLWQHYGLSPELFEELQRASSSKSVALRPTTSVAPKPGAIIASHEDEALSDTALLQMVRHVVREELIRVAQVQVGTVVQGSQPAQIALRLTRANGTEVSVVLLWELARDMAMAILRRDMVGDED